MNKLRPAAWIALGLGAALLAFAFTGSASGVVPAGYQSIQVGPGSFGALAVPPGGRVAFVLPTGALWAQGIMGGGGIPANTPISFTSSPGFTTTTGPLLLSGIASGATLFLQWNDATGAHQSSAYAFT
jgi:hypothetical protein